jgi:hypothetical protein
MNRQVNQDLEHLKILSIFYYVASGLCLFPMLYGVIYMVIGLFFGAVFSTADIPHRPGEPSPEVFGGIFGGIFALVGFIIASISLTLGILLLKAGRNLSKQASYTFCFIIACISCVFIPLGTILGVFTIVILTRESVKAIFN